MVVLVIDIDTDDISSDMLVRGVVEWWRWWSVEMVVAMMVEIMVTMVVEMMVEMVVAMVIEIMVEMVVAMVIEIMVEMVVAMDREKEEVVVGGLGTEVRWVLSGLAQASSFIC